MDRDINDPCILRARRVLESWIAEINEVGMMSTKRSYVGDLILQRLESKIVAEILIDKLADEFAKDLRDETPRRPHCKACGIGLTSEDRRNGRCSYCKQSLSEYPPSDASIVRRPLREQGDGKR